MSERSASPTADITKRQKTAANPLLSVWVEANAGAGKTHVLVERVLRLLLEKVPPQNLLCLTYTNAAAAEMRIRASKKLAGWTLMSDADLTRELELLTSKKIDEKTLNIARKLFATALETPGGLKVNTIHAFCESVLHRFAFEAKVPLNFTLMEESETNELLKSASEQVLAQALQNKGDNIAAAKWLFANLSDAQINDAINCALGNIAQLRTVFNDKQGAKNRLKKLVGYKENETIENLREEIILKSFLPTKNYADVFAVCPPDETKTRFEDKLAKIDLKNPDPDAIMGAFLKADFTVPVNFPKKAFKEALGGLGDILLDEAHRLADIHQRMIRAKLVTRSSAFIDILSEIFEKYQQQKTFRSMLDFDDLIERVAYLFSSGASMDWVLYKLDSNISHILVDESQDTNAQQWVIVKKLCEEFFVGKTKDESQRSIFAVGDKKQSIFSFQGAKPTLFGQCGVEIKLKAKNAKKSFANVELKASFRTLPNILKAVDLVCEQDGMNSALLADGHDISHESARDDKGGLVCLWPPIKQQDVTLPPDRWPLETDALEVRNAARIAAQNITENIENWIDTKRPLAQRGRAVKADDILILLQSRKALFYEIIRALKSKNIKTPGSDRISLSNHIVVLDLLALADILLNPSDDLSLAAILRSPLFEIDENDLFELAALRGKNISLWQALKTSSNQRVESAYQDLKSWRDRLDFERPYEFFAQILYAQGGLKKFHSRLGSEIDDIVAEFLDLAFAHEQKSQPSLLGFINSMRNADISIKRDLAASGHGVRIMTIHGAKGLEAPIVILADAASGPNITKMGKKVNYVAPPEGPSLVHASKKEDFCEKSQYLRQNDIDNERAEYWRKLYVAMTRAEDELYVTGMLTKKGKIEGTWYEMIEKSLLPDSHEIEIKGSEIKGLVFPKTQIEPKAIKIIKSQTDKEKAALPPNIFTLKYKPKKIEIIRPSSAYQLDELDSEREVFDTKAQAIQNAELARKKGIALHALLEHLPKIGIEKRKKIGFLALEILLPNETEWHEELVEKALNILSSKEFAFIFGENSRSEVPFLFDAIKNDKKITIAGRIDRIIINDEKVIMVDFKSDKLVPKNQDLVPSSYMMQLGLYKLAGKKLFPEKQITAAILWTQGKKLILLDEKKLEKAVENFSLL